MSDLIKGDYQPPNTGRQTRNMMRVLQKYGPGTARTFQDIEEEIQPRQMALQTGLLQQYAPLLTALGIDLSGQQQLGDVANARATIAGGGRELVSDATGLDRQVNPEFYANRELGASGLQSLIGGMDPNKLSGAEMANVERGVNRLNQRRGNTNISDATTTAANALQFDDRLQQKRAAFGQALNLIPGIQSASRSPIDAFNVATGRSSSSPNFGQQQFQNTQPTGTGQSLLGSIQGTQQQKQEIEAGRRTGQDFLNQAYGTAVGSVCGCYIFREHYHMPDVPDYVRWCRDFYYKQTPAIASGYKRMAKWIVPLMRRYTLVRLAVSYGCILPLAQYGKYLTGQNKWCVIFKPFKLWLTFWKYYAKQA